MKTDAQTRTRKAPDTGQTRGDTIRVVVRALRLLKLMNGRPVWALRDLHLATRLPKSTLSRLLSTLIGEGYVRADDVAGAYRLTAKIRELDAGYTEQSALIEAGRKIALDVTRRIKWPLAMGTPDGDAIVVSFSTMPYSPLAVHTTTLGHRHSLLESALGRAYLAFASPVETQVLFDHLIGLDPLSGGHSLDWARQDLARVRADGYAVRQPSADRGSATLAVPLLQDGFAIAALSMTTFGKAMTRATIDAHAPVLASTARAIVAAYEASATTAIAT